MIEECIDTETALCMRTVHIKHEDGIDINCGRLVTIYQMELAVEREISRRILEGSCVCLFSAPV